jgi:hypothetical protein
MPRQRTCLALAFKNAGAWVILMEIPVAKPSSFLSLKNTLNRIFFGGASGDQHSGEVVSLAQSLGENRKNDKFKGKVLFGQKRLFLPPWIFWTILTPLKINGANFGFLFIFPICPLFCPPFIFSVRFSFLEHLFYYQQD